MKHRRQPRIGFLVRGIDNGGSLLFPFQGLSLLTLRNAVAGVLGVGIGLATLYMAARKGHLGFHCLLQFTASEAVPSSELYVSGLQNLGNNCFLNVILQALASCGSFFSFLENALAIRDLQLVGNSEEMPLISALAALLEELSSTRDTSVVLSPRKVMQALNLYATHFSLSRQQDASEALVHLLTSLDVEISEFYVPHGCSLANIMTNSSTVCNQILKIQNECTQMHKYAGWPLSGTTGSLIICSTCSSLISLDFEVFRCLPLSPLLDMVGDIIDGCSLVDCLRKYTAVESLQHYRCGRCWHLGALQYLSLQIEKDEAKMLEISQCITLEDCHCGDLFLPGEICWSGSSRAMKQLSVASCPRILCVHLQRAFMSNTGELVKLQGHISFPLLLDLAPFSGAPKELRRSTLFETMQGAHDLSQPLLSCSAISVKDGSEQAVTESRDATFTTTEGLATMDVDQELDLKAPSIGTGGGLANSCLYHLSSVVEHYGRVGGGHYAVYRRALASSDGLWFYVSDHNVSAVSEEAVLSAEASLLFYERIN